jgi:hypothetical protein
VGTGSTERTKNPFAAAGQDRTEGLSLTKAPERFANAVQGSDKAVAFSQITPLPEGGALEQRKNLTGEFVSYIFYVKL